VPEQRSTVALLLACLLGALACTELLDPEECGSFADCGEDKECRDGLCVASVARSDAGAPIPGDGDGDGYAALDDCNDQDREVHPGALDLCGDERDWDCSGQPEASCAAWDIAAPGLLAAALARTRLGLAAAFVSSMPGGEAQLRRYSDDGRLAFAAPLVGSRSASSILASDLDGRQVLWFADGQANRVWRVENPPGGGLPLPVEYRLEGGRPLEPASLASRNLEDPADHLLFVGGQFGDVGLANAAFTSATRSLAGVPNPAFVATSHDGALVLVASQPDLTLRGFGVDRFGDPELVDSLALPGLPRGLGVAARRAVVLLSGRIVEVDLDRWALAGDGVDVPDTVTHIAVDPEGAWTWAADSAGVLHVIDRGRDRVVRRVDLLHARDVEEPLAVRPVALLAERGGRCLVLLVGTSADADGVTASWLMVVEP